MGILVPRALQAQMVPLEQMAHPEKPVLQALQVVRVSKALMETRVLPAQAVQMAPLEQMVPLEKLGLQALQVLRESTGILVPRAQPVLKVFRE